MLADVVCLRRHGERLPVELAKAAKPVRGSLRLDARHAYAAGRTRPLHALLVAVNESRYLLPCLDHCKVTRISERGLLIVGTEEVEVMKRVWMDHRQAWWVRPVLLGGADQVTMGTGRPPP